MNLKYNTAAFLLSLAIADKALINVDSLEGLQKEILRGQDELILDFKDEVLDRPILRKCTKKDGETDEKMPKEAFLRIFRETLKNAGYFCGTSIHAIRRNLGKKVDGKSHVSLITAQDLN